jgi:hypothetical protein
VDITGGIKAAGPSNFFPFPWALPMDTAQGCFAWSILFVIPRVVAELGRQNRYVGKRYFHETCVHSSDEKGRETLNEAG